MAKQRSLILIKPDAVQRHLIGEVISRFEAKGLTIVALEYTNSSEHIVDQHYPLHDRNYILTLGHVDITGRGEEELEQIYKKNHKIVSDLKEFLNSGPLVKMILEGDDAVKFVREIVGKTDPGQSPKGSIRGDLGNDSFAVSDKEERAVRNLVHASGTSEEAEAEIKLWFPEHN